MRRASTSRRPGPAGLASALAVLALATGCTHHYYYGATPAYVVPGETVIVDEVCELPARTVTDAPALVTRPAKVASSSSSASSPTDPEVVTSSRTSRVVISRPIGGPVAGRGWSPLGSGNRLVTTEVQGGADATLIR